MTMVKIVLRDLGSRHFDVNKKKETIQYEIRCAIDHKTSVLLYDIQEKEEYIINADNIIYFTVKDDGESKDITH
jgi:hypothetical protein